MPSLDDCVLHIWYNRRLVKYNIPYAMIPDDIITIGKLDNTLLLRLPVPIFTIKYSTVTTPSTAVTNKNNPIHDNASKNQQ